jgi:hypothetical protein
MKQKLNIRKWKIMQVLWIKRIYIKYLLKKIDNKSKKMYRESLKNN